MFQQVINLVRIVTNLSAFIEDRGDYLESTTQEQRQLIKQLGYDGWRDQLKWIETYGPERVLHLKQDHDRSTIRLL